MFLQMMTARNVFSLSVPGSNFIISAIKVREHKTIPQWPGWEREEKKERRSALRSALNQRLVLGGDPLARLQTTCQVSFENAQICTSPQYLCFYLVSEDC